MNILVIAPNWIGDALMAQPLLRRLRAQSPQAHIAVLAPSHVAPLLAYMPEVSEVLSIPFQHGRWQWRLRWKVAHQLRSRRAPFDRAYVLPNSWKSALLPWLARIPQRIGYLGEWRWGMLTEPWPNPARRAPRPPMAQFYATLAGGDARGDYFNAERPRLQVPAADVDSAYERWLATTPDASPRIAFCPGAEYGPAKRYPASHFARLAELICMRWPRAQILCLGGPKDRSIAESIAQQSTATILNLCGTTQLKEAVAVMRSVDAVVTNDSGLMHIAAALDIPLVALYGSTDPQHTPPYSPHARIMQLKLDCSPCFARECPLGHLRCLRDLSPEQVCSTLIATIDTDHA